jgi:hypothetical protein
MSICQYGSLRRRWGACRVLENYFDNLLCEITLHDYQRRGLIILNFQHFFSTIPNIKNVMETRL